MSVGRHHAVVDLPLTPGRLGWPGKDDGGSVEPADHELGDVSVGIGRHEVHEVGQEILVEGERDLGGRSVEHLAVLGARRHELGVGLGDAATGHEDEK